MIANLVTLRLEVKVKLLADFFFEQHKSLSFYTFPETIEHNHNYTHEDSVWLNKTGNICWYFSAFSQNCTSDGRRYSMSVVIPGHNVQMAAF